MTIAWARQILVDAVADAFLFFDFLFLSNEQQATANIDSLVHHLNSTPNLQYRDYCSNTFNKLRCTTALLARPFPCHIYN